MFRTWKIYNDCASRGPSAIAQLLVDAVVLMADWHWTYNRPGKLTGCDNTPTPLWSVCASISDSFSVFSVHFIVFS